jgi:hypothetical protein
VSDPVSGARRLAFERVSIRRMPGFEAGGFTLDGLSPGVNVVHGPNESGKTTAGRAMRLLLWPGSGEAEVSIAAVLAVAGERWEIDLDRDRVRYRQDGAPSGPPPLPPADAADRYALALHDLLQADARGEDLAAAVAREAAGGYDLEAARQAVGARPRASNPQKRRTEYEAAYAKVREVEEEQRRTASEAADLARLETERAAAREAKDRLELLDAALERARCRERLARAEEELAAFPRAMERLTGEEGERSAELRARLEAAVEARERARSAIGAERRRLAEARLPEGGVPDGLLDALGERREHLARLEQEIEQRGRELAAARARREQALGELGPEAGGERLAAFRVGDWTEVLGLVESGDQLRAERIELEALAAWVGEPVPVEEIDRRMASLSAEAGLLRDWLGQPAAGWRTRVPALVAALVLAAAAVAGGLLVHPGWWGLAAVAGLIVLWCWAGVGRELRDRAALERRHDRVAGAAPIRWQRDAVTKRLEDLDGLSASLHGDRQRSGRQAELARRRARLDADAAALEASRRRLAERLGLAPEVHGLAPAPLAALVHSLGRWRQAQDDVQAAEAALGEARGERERELDAIRRTMAPYGGAEVEEESAPGFDVTDAASTRGAVDALARRAEAHRRAAEALDRLAGEGGELARAEGEIERTDAAWRQLFARLDLEAGDEGALAGLLGRLAGYRSAVRICQEATAALRLAEARLGADGESGESDPVALEAEREAAAAVAGRLEELADRLGGLRERVARAKTRHDLENALAAREAAEEALRDERERDAGAVVAWVLADWLRERTRGVQRPAVMARAAALFARITGGAMRLLDPVGDPPIFRAEDTRAGVSRDLDELSAGRRLQLLVAVRMGFVEEQERGVRVPLVMDETLANSDDASAEALIGAVVELAREGRQVFYFTAQDDEVAKWRAALAASADDVKWQVLGLSEVRRLEAKRRAPRREWRPREREIPEPGKLGREAYGKRLGVPGLDPRSEPGAVHLWYLVEEVDVLHGLLLRGLASWGELQALTSDAGATLPGEGGEGERLEARMAARGRCLQVLFRGWRIGRGRPVDRGVLAASGAVSERFLDEVSDLAERVDAEAAALAAALAEGEVKGFRSDKTEQLAAYLREEGHLDERPVLTAAELRELAFAELAAEIEAGQLTPAAVDELLAQLPD